MQLKSTLITLAAVCSMLPAAHADVLTYTGDTTGAPTFNRPIVGLDALSGTGTQVAYDTYSFSVSVSGDYTFTTTGTFDTFALLYGPTFNPASSLTNALIADDDVQPGTANISSFTLALAAGSAYTHVTTGFYNFDFGTYTNTFEGPGAFLAPVPEPGTWALMALGLAAFGVQARRRRAAG